MRFLPITKGSWSSSLLLALLWTSSATRATAFSFASDHSFSSIQALDDTTSELNFSTNNRTDEVGWDKYSLFVKGQRILLYSGEFHTFRLPVPSLWPDILQKIKAAGLNAISVYLHWGLTNPTPGVVDFDSFRDLQPLYDAAREAGIWIVLRPGPYINAETTAGGIAHWVTTEVAGTLRTNATDYQAAWTPYIQAVIDKTIANQVTEGGPVIAIQIDNEYSQTGYGLAEYFQQLEDVYLNSSIVVPWTYNDPGEKDSFINGTGAVDIYGVDGYPQNACATPLTWRAYTTDYYDHHAKVNPNEPMYFPEWEGGYNGAWGPNAPGYDGCRLMTGPDYESVYYRSLWAANGKMINFYMVYGGTSWGGLPFPGVYTSYDYGAAIAENRDINTKYDELKLQAIFLRSSPEFYKTDWIGNSSTSAVTVSNPDAFAVKLMNPDTSSSYWIVRQNDSASTAITSFTMDILTSVGNLTIPQAVSNITLGGRQSKMILGDYSFGANSRVLYSTAQVMFAGQIGSRDVILLYGDSNQEHEASIYLQGTPTIQTNSSSIAFSSLAQDVNATNIALSEGIEGLVTLWDSDLQLVLYADYVTASTFWAPVIASGSTEEDPFARYWQFGTNTTVLVGGPHLVRNASISDSGSLDIRGDLNSSVTLTVIAPPTVSSVTWNSEPVGIDDRASAAVTSIGGFIGNLEMDSGRTKEIVAPVLENWRFADSLPEVLDGYDDGSWTVANRTTSNIPYPMNYGDGRILYQCDYQFCENIAIWRGHFNSTGMEASMNLSLNGGEAFAASVWVNDWFLKTSYGNSSDNKLIIDETDEVYTFSNGSLRAGEDNVVTVVIDNMGISESNNTNYMFKSPRGIRGFHLSEGEFSTWKVQGKVGGYNNFPDKHRGVLNEGGLFGERQGWHLPDFDTSTSSWSSRDLSSGLPDSQAGVGFFVTTFDLSLPDGYDVMLSFNFEDEGEPPYRALLFVNGWQMGKRVGNLGPQTKFPVHEGILDYNGTNTVAVALWAMEAVAISPNLSVTVDTVLQGGVGGVVANNPGWSPEGRV
ncbi:glycoside hydrolase family 35 protein [Stereum hirsutum FP-91666 SS1]|uniref:glycoside hydrolase family 35 protein n=1 Tax=Stereum hirsutum (strain FP-91666) TaxID=721885 RepID=UPI000440E82E|nr:glycoside hydrolase family 35 protein [Stereum hirsutum FP-91666 SS1]EIM90945.1 glycoside hydrolase family 35 protein [Stereum hirsutum FP-91666 SS1]